MSETMPDLTRLQLLGALKEISKSANRLDATIVTTFAFNGPFYEDVVLRSFERAGSRLNIVLVDARQLAESLSDEMRRPRRAGHDYVLCPVEHARAFHPKLLVLLSEKQRGLAVGSHNLTDAGYGHNEEISSFWDIRDDAPALLVEPALEYCLAWLERAQTLPHTTFKDVAGRLRSMASARSDDTAAEPLECELALDSDGALWTTLERQVTGRIRRAIVAGPYFDQDFGLLRRVSETLTPKELIVAVEPEMVLLGDLKRVPAGARFVDLSIITTAAKRRGEPRFSHAKLIALETEQGWVVSTGSANPTKAGWGIGAGANAEANVILTGKRAAAAVAKLGLDRLSEARTITQAELTAGAARSAEQRKREKEEQDQRLPPLLQGQIEEGAIVTERGLGGVDLAACELWTGTPELWAGSYSITHRGDGIEVRAKEAFASGLYSVRRNREVVAYVLVHDNVALRASSTSREATQLLSSLGRIDQYEGFDEVFDLITRHVIDAEPKARAPSEAPTSSTKTDERVAASEEEAPYGPRGVSLADDRVAKSRNRLFAHGLVSDLLSTLIASLYVAATPGAPTTDGDAPDRDAEEAEEGEESGEDIASNVEGAVLIKDVDWPRVVRACRQRTTTLINRLKNKLTKIEPEPSWELGKLLSVMCLVQKLRLLPPPPDMILVTAPESLVKWDHLQSLYAFTVNYVYGTGKLSERLAKAGGANAHERLLLDNQLLWYARELGVDCDRDVSTAEDSETRDEVLQDRADLVVIAFSAATGDGELWLKERARVLSRWDDSDAVARDWFARHRAIGETLQAMLGGSQAEARKSVAIKDGGYAIWKAEPRLPRVVRSVSGGKVSLYEPGERGEKKFMLAGLEGIDLSDRRTS